MNLEEYSELLLERDKLEKEAEQWRIEYLRHFGDLEEELLNLRMSCIKYKKLIAFCQQQVNYGRDTDVSQLMDYIQIELMPLRQKILEIRNAKNIELHPLSQYEVKEIKRIYRFIAKRLHPDINPQLFGINEVQELWHDTLKAYKANDYTRLTELEVIATSVIEKYCDETVAVVIGDIDEKIEKVKEQCEEIRTSEPYTFKYFFDDPDAVRAKNEEYASAIEEYKVYENDLKKIFEGYGVELEDDQGDTDE